MFKRSRSTGQLRRGMAVATVPLLVLAACGGDDDSGGAAGTAAPDSTAAGSTPEGTSAPDGSEPAGTAAPSGATVQSTVAPGEGVYGGELVVGVIFDAFGLEPATIVGQSADGHIAQALYDNLMTYNTEGEPVGWLAKSMTTTDQQNWTIELRKGVEFHDGTPLDAEAVKFNLERHQDPELSSRNAANANNIDTITVVDPLTVELELKFPWASFDEIMIGNLGLMASPTAIESGTINEEPVGTGPFVFSERIVGDRIVVERNENYWREGEPYLDRIVYRVMLDDQVRIDSLKAGEIDAAQERRAGPLASPEEEGLESTSSPGRANTIYMNQEDGPTADVRVRQAMAQALDYDAINEVIFDGAGRSEYRLVGSSNSYYDPSVEFPGYDPEAAQALVEEYEAENGPIEFTFRTYNGPVPSQMSQMVTQMWTQAGMDVENEVSDQGTLVSDMLQGNFQVGHLATRSDNVDPDLIYYNALHSETTGNYGNYSNPEMDAALELGRQSNDEDERMEAYSTVQELFAEDMPIIEWSKSPGGWMLAPNVHGLVALPGTDFHPSTVYISEE